MKKARIMVMRHGDKDGDCLTPKGAAQIFAAVQALENQGFTFKRILYGGANRTRQCALIATAVLGLNSSILKQNPGFHFEKPYEEALNSDIDLFKAEVAEIKKAGGTVAGALEISEYARLSRSQLVKTLINVADDIAINMGDILSISHSPYSELAVPLTIADKFPYQIGEADTVVYTIKDRVIIDAGLIRAPEI